MKITYIHHSGFLAETNQALLLFDFAGGSLPPLDPAKTLVVFVSHRHEDHFNPEIFTLADSHPHTVYVLSDDICRTGFLKSIFPEHILLIRAG